MSNHNNDRLEIVFIEEQYRKEIESILPAGDVLNGHNAEFYKILKRGMIYPKELSKNKILFIGINPSFDDKNKKNKNIIKQEGEAFEGHHEIGYNQIFFDEEISKKIPAKGYQSYFKIFEEISSKIEKRNGDYFSWTHFDTLPFREVNQKNITKLINKTKEPKIYKIVEKYIELSKQIIEESNPEIIVVSNAYVRNLFGYYDNENKKELENIPKMFSTVFDPKFGTHKIDDNGPLHGKLVFFTSMLSGQRALDIGSRDRLIWHIKHCLNK
jgi:hypothetical protein